MTFDEEGKKGEENKPAEVDSDGYAEDATQSYRCSHDVQLLFCFGRSLCPAGCDLVLAADP